MYAIWLLLEVLDTTCKIKRLSNEGVLNISFMRNIQTY